MLVAKKKPVVKKREKSPVVVRERNPLVRNIIKSIGDWSVGQKIAIVRTGVSKAELEKVKEETGLDYEMLSRILSVTKATLHNKKGAAKFNADISERLLVFAEIYVYGVDVFGAQSKFIHWIGSPIRATGGIAPMELMDTLYGMEEVKRIIGRIDYGVYS